MLAGERESAARRVRASRVRTPCPSTSRHPSRGPSSSEHPTEAGRERERDSATLPELAHVELSAGLQPDDEEEERHQTAVEPVAEVVRHASVADPNRQRRMHHTLVRGRVHVRPDERRDGGGEQHRCTAGLGAQEAAQRRLEVAHPGRAAGEGRLLRRRAGQDVATRQRSSRRHIRVVGRCRGGSSDRKPGARRQSALSAQAAATGSAARGD